MDIRPDETPETVPAMPRANRRLFYRFLGGIFLLFGGIFALIVYTDAEPPKVDDLRHPPLAPAGNTYYDRFLRFAAEKGCEPIIPYAEPDDLPESNPHRMTAGGTGTFEGSFPEFLAEGKGWAPERIATWAPQINLFVANCARLADETAFPDTRGATPAPDATMSTDSLVMAACANLDVAIGMYWASGDKNRALETAFRFEEFGRRMRESAPGPQVYLDATDATTMAERSIARLGLRDTTMTKAALERFRDPPPEDPAKFTRILHAQYFEFEQWIDAQSVAANAAQNHRTPPFFKTLAQTRVLFRWVMKPNQTKHFYADYVRTQVPLADLNTEDYRRLPESMVHRFAFSDLTRPTNLYGRMLAYQGTWGVQNTINRRTRGLTQRSLIRACLALRVFHDERGSLPERLDELVPDYLPEVPIDHANGQTLRYSRALAYVWSAGLDDLQIHSAYQHIGYNEDFYRLEFAMPMPATTDEADPPADTKKAPPEAGP